MKHLTSTSPGFTIVELLISTAVFATVLLLSTFGLLQIGRTYYKGVTSNRTQETARIILDEVADAIRFGSGTPAVPAQAGGGTPGMYCAGGKRFSYLRARQLVEGAPNGTQARHVLVVDDVGTCSASTPAQNLSNPSVVLTPGSRELMNTRMRLTDFSVTPVGGTTNLYDIRVRVVSGDENQLVDLIGADGIRESCVNERTGSQFCAASELSTVVEKRIK